MNRHDKAPTIFRRVSTSMLFLFGLAILTGCTNSGNAVSVSIHGVNYSGEEFTYSVEDTANADNRGGGETVTPYAAGGTMCCYELPRRWRPGIQVKVNLTRYLPKKSPDDPLPEVKEVHTVELPAYADSKPGELWVVRNADGTVGVVSSDYQPDHEKWPGKVKGWPVPSLEYRRERWDLHIQLAESDVKMMKEVLQDFEKAPDKEAEEDWNYRRELAAKYIEDAVPSSTNTLAKENRDLLARFSGSTDPKFRAWLKQHNEDLLNKYELKLKQLKESRP